MTVIFGPSDYSLPSGDESLKNARIAHSNNWLTGGTTAASSTDADYFADAPDNSLTYEKWKPNTLPATWRYDLGVGATSEVDYCLIAAHTMGRNGNTLQIQYDNGTGTFVNIIPATAIITDEPIYAIFEPQDRQIFRIRISSGTPPTIGVIRFGKSLQMQRSIYGGHAPALTTRNTTFQSNVSNSGEFLGRSVRRVMRPVTFAWQNLTAQWVEDNWRDAQLAMENEPIGIVWRPEDRGDVVYGAVDETPIPENQGRADLMDVSLTVRGRGYD